MSTTGKAESYIELRGSLSIPDAITGKSAYEIAVMNGFEGTEAEWLESLTEQTKANAEEVIAAADRAIEEMEEAGAEALNDIAEAKEAMLAEIEVAGEIVQTMGDSETAVMSQRAVTNEFGKYFTTEKSINLFDKSLPREPNFIVGNGTVIQSDPYEIATMSVEVGKAYTFPIYYSMIGYSAAYYVACYDKDLNYIGYITGTPTADNALLTANIGTKVYNNTVWEYVDAEIAFIKVNVGLSAQLAANVDTFMFVEGTEYPSEYIPYDASKIYLNDKVIVSGDISSPLKGKKVVFTGDSICAGTSDESGVHGWAQRIGEKYSMNWQNKGKNGATISSGVSGSSGCIADTDFGENPDYIILEGGTNDADLIGSADNFTPEKFGSYTLGQYNAEFDKTTFCGAVEHLFKRITTDYAGAKIGFIIAHKMGYATTVAHYDAETSRRRFYFETIIKLCAKWGIPYLDLWNGSYLCPMNPAHNTANTNLMYVGDYQHLAKKGYDYITPMIEKWMETL